MTEQQQPKSNKKREKSFLSLGNNHWKPVHVELEDDDNKEKKNVNTAAEEETHNHYDNPKLGRKAKRDLPVNPGEDVAIFYGLEVLENYQTLDSLEGGASSNSNKGKKDTNNETTISKRSEAAAKKKNKQETKTDSSSSNDKEHAVDSAKDSSTKKKNTKNKKKQKKKTTESNEVGEQSTAVTEEKKSSLQRTAKKRKTRKEFSASSSNNDEDDVTEEGEASEEVEQDGDSEMLQQISQRWSQDASGVVLHPTLVNSLAKQHFSHPTPIQAATLSAAILGRRNLVGAAPTGSGKTLAFLLPILQSLLEQQDEQQQQDTDNSNETSSSTARPAHHHVQAMIVTPTRELATQIHSECDKLFPDQCVSLVGGIAIVKQKRLLSQKKPSVVIGTPGRLWAMVRW